MTKKNYKNIKTCAKMNKKLKGVNILLKLHTSVETFQIIYMFYSQLNMISSGPDQ